MALFGPSPDEITAARLAILRELVIVGTQWDVPSGTQWDAALSTLVGDNLVKVSDDTDPRRVTLDRPTDPHSTDVITGARCVLMWLERSANGKLPAEWVSANLLKVLEQREAQDASTWLRTNGLITVRDDTVRDLTGSLARPNPRTVVGTSKSVIRAQRAVAEKRVRANYDKIVQTRDSWFEHPDDSKWTESALSAVRAATHAELRKLTGASSLPTDAYRQYLSKAHPDHHTAVLTRLTDAGFLTIDGNVIRTSAGLPERSWDDTEAEHRRVAEKKEAAAAAKAAEAAERKRERGLRHYLLEAAKQSTGVVSTPTAEPYMSELVSAGLLTLDGNLHTYTNPTIDSAMSPDELTRARTVTANWLRVLMGESPLSDDTDESLAMSRLRGILVDDGALIESGSVIAALSVVVDDHRQRQEEAARAEAERQAAAKAEAERQAEEERQRQEEAERREIARLERAKAARAERIEQERAAVEEAQAAATATATATATAKAAQAVIADAEPVSGAGTSADRLDLIARDARMTVRMLDTLGPMVRHLINGTLRQADTLQARMIRDADPDVRRHLVTLVAKLGTSGGEHRTLPKNVLRKGLANRPRADGSPPDRAFFDMALELGARAEVLRMTTDGHVELVDYSLLLTDADYARRCAAMVRRQSASEKSWAKRLVSA